MTAKFDYGRMAATAARLLEQFSQGNVTLRRSIAQGSRPSGLPVWEAWNPPVEVREYRIDAAVRGVSAKWVNGDTIKVSDLEMVCPDKLTLVSVNGEPVAEVVQAFDIDLAETVWIDGTPHTIITRIPTPGAGAKIVHRLILRGGAVPASAAPLPPGPVSVSAPASAVADAGRPVLTLVVSAPAGALADVGGPIVSEPGEEVAISAPAVAEAAVGLPVRLVAVPAQGPQILWSITGQASGDFDWTGQELEEGDVVFCMMAGTWSHHGASYPTTANGPVTNNGFFYVWTPGDFQRTMSLTARVVTAGNIGDRVATRGNVHDSGVVFAVRGLDLDQFTTEPGGGGWPWLADQARVAFRGGTNANPPPIGGVEVGDMVLGVCNVWQSSPIISAPAPYIEERVYLSSGRSPSDRFTGISYLIAEAAGTYDPDQWSGFQSGRTGGAVTMRLSPL